CSSCWTSGCASMFEAAAATPSATVWILAIVCPISAIVAAGIFAAVPRLGSAPASPEAISFTSETACCATWEAVKPLQALSMTATGTIAVAASRRRRETMVFIVISFRERGSGVATDLHGAAHAGRGDGGGVHGLRVLELADHLPDDADDERQGSGEVLDRARIGEDGRERDAENAGDHDGHLDDGDDDVGRHRSRRRRHGRVGWRRDRHGRGFLFGEGADQRAPAEGEPSRMAASISGPRPEPLRSSWNVQRVRRPRAGTAVTPR